MENRWYCRVRNQQLGPLSWPELLELVRRGSLTVHSLVRNAEETTWIEAGQVPELFATARATMPPPPPAAMVPAAAAGSGPSVPPPFPAPPSSLPVGIPIGTAINPADAAVVSAPPSGGEAPLSLITPVTRGANAKRGSAAAVKVQPKAQAGRAEAEAAEAETPAAARKRRQQAARKKLILLASGLIAVVAAIGGIAFYATRPSASTTAPTTVAQDPANQPGEGASGDVAGAPVADTAEGGSATSTKTASTKTTSTNTATGAATTSANSPVAGGAVVDAARQAAIDNILKTISPWRDASRATGVSTKSMRLQVTGMWMAGGGEGKEARPRAVCAEVRVSCLPTAESPFTYNSWNVTGSEGKSPSILLVESTGAVHSLIPISQWADPARQTAPVKLQPGQTVDDLLVFTAPTSDSIEHVRLALKMSNLGQGERYLGLQFPRELIAASKPLEGKPLRPAAAGAAGLSGAANAADAAAQAAAGGGAGGVAATKNDAAKSDAAKEDEKPAGKMVEGAEAATAKPAKPALSPDEDINVLKKQIEDSVKENKAAREKDVQELQKKEEEKRQQDGREATAGEKGKSPPAAGKPPRTGTGSPKKPN